MFLLLLSVVVPVLLAFLAHLVGLLQFEAGAVFRPSPFGFLILLLLGAGFIALARGVRGLASPVGDVIEAAGRLETGDYRVRVAERGPRDVRALARAFNTMASRLEASEEHRRALFADLSHELRTPLAVVQGNLEGIIDGLYTADAGRLGTILDETKILARLIEDLRTLSLADAGALRLFQEPVNLGALARDTAASLRPRADEAGATVVVNEGDAVPDVNADPVRMREVLTNLIANALRYSPRGGRVRVTVAAEEGRVVVSVGDEGPGIAPELRGRLFERFAKSEGSPGAGLGLAIAKSLVVAHGGEIGVESEPGAGTRIRFTVPGAGTP